MTRLRQTIARRLKDAQNTAAILTTYNEADMSAIMAARKAHQEAFVAKHDLAPKGWRVFDADAQACPEPA